MSSTLDSPVDLVILNSAPTGTSGDCICVAHDLAKLRTKEGGFVVQFLRSSRQVGVPDIGPVFMRSHWDVARSVIRHRIHSAPSAQELRKALPLTPTSVYIADTTLYPATRKAFPQAHIVARAQNSFALLKPRIPRLPYRESPRLRITIARMVRVERQMMQDALCSIVCLTEKDADAFTRLGGAAPVTVEATTTTTDTYTPTRVARRLSFLGGMSGHKIGGMKHFLEADFKSIRDSNPGIRLDLWGSGTEQFRGDGFTGHGRWSGESVLPFDGDALFVNPDYLGGGLKRKVGTYLDASVPFITTERGAEGFQLPDSTGIMVSDVANWPQQIADYFGC